MGTVIQEPLCGNIEYDCQFMNLPVDKSTKPVRYDSSKQIFNIYSEDRDLIGMQDYSCQAKLTDYPDVISQIEQG